MEGNDSAHLRKNKILGAKKIWGNCEEVISEMPVWKIQEIPNREYFDGIYHYFSESYYVFKFSDVYGNITLLQTIRLC